MDVKQKLEEIVELMNPLLEKEWQVLLDQKYGFNQREKDLIEKMVLHAKEHNLRSAKRLRASLVYYGFLLNSDLDEKIYRAMCGAEMVHTALLMHDDVMDKDSLRRGKPTTHYYFGNGESNHYGESMAYSLGDSVTARGYSLVLNCGFEDKRVILATSHLLQSIVYTGYGQAFDVSLEQYVDWSEEDVIALHKTKTAIYTYENPLYIGAILGGCDEKVLEILSRYAMEGGVAFQLQDDVLGVFGDSDKTGKSDDSDLLQGKRTLLIKYALDKASSEQRKAMEKVWGKQQALEVDIKKAKKVLMEIGSLDYSMKISREYAKKAAGIAKELYPLVKNKEAVDYLVGIAIYMVEREV